MQFEQLKIECKVLDRELYLDKDGVPTSNWPLYSTIHSAGLDLRIAEDVTLHPGESKLVSTGLCIWIKQPGVAGLILPRSGSGVKGTVIGNGTGVIDADYQGEVKVCLYNRNPTMRVAPPNKEAEDQMEARAADMQAQQERSMYWYSPLRDINEENGLRLWKRGDRVAQLLLVPIFSACFFPVDEFSYDTGRGVAGFGSTGIG